MTEYDLHMLHFARLKRYQDATFGSQDSTIVSSLIRFHSTGRPLGLSEGQRVGRLRRVSEDAVICSGVAQPLGEFDKEMKSTL